MARVIWGGEAGVYRGWWVRAAVRRAAKAVDGDAAESLGYVGQFGDKLIQTFGYLGRPVT
jgi:hypothetical protein